MKFHTLNLLIIVLSTFYKVSAEDENKSDCELALEWLNFDNTRDISDCCVSDSDPFFCNTKNKIESINLNSMNTDIPNISRIPKLDDLISLQIADYSNDLTHIKYNLHYNLFKQQNLKIINIDSNYLNDMATKIDPNCPLEELTLKNTQLKTLAKSIFKLNNLKKIELVNNFSMNVKIVKFKNSPIECNFENTNIECYQEGACSNISSNNYRKCTDDEINEILENKKNETSNNQSNSDDKNNSNSENGNKSNGIVIGTIVGICIIIILASVIIIKKLNKKDKLNDKLNNYIDFNLYERKKKVKLDEESYSSNSETNITKSHNEEKIQIIDSNNDNMHSKIKKNDNNNSNIKMIINNINIDNNNNNNSYKILKIANSNSKNIDVNPSVSEEFPIVDNSNLVDECSILPSYSQIEHSHAVQPFRNVDIESKLLLKTKKAALNDKE